MQEADELDNHGGRWPHIYIAYGVCLYFTRTMTNGRTFPVGEKRRAQK